MCDTFVCPPSLSVTGNWIFGKNSDREPNEVQLLRQYPSRTNTGGDQQCTYIKTKHSKYIYSTILSQPAHMWGAEMGVNEKGVAIGNEAVFTKVGMKKKNSGLTGMDMLRLALECCSTAEEAVHKLKELNEQYGQDGNGGYQSKFFYHNSFLVVDPQRAFVMETAGKYWAVEKVKGFRSISNGLTIGSDYDELHPEAIDFSRKKGWIQKGREFSFSKAFSSFWMPKLSCCKTRRELAESQGRDGFSVRDAFNILRSHSKEKYFSPYSSGTGSICMHATGILAPHQTAATMVAELRSSGLHTVWATGSSIPCLGIFTPFYFGSDSLTEHSMQERQHWQRWEHWHRKAVHNYSAVYKLLDELRFGMEEHLVINDRSFAGRNLAYILSLLSQDALKRSDEILRNMPEPRADKIPFFYRRFWNRVDSRFEPMETPIHQ